MPKRKATSALVTREPSPHIESLQLRLDLDCKRLRADEMVGALEDGSVTMSSSEYNENVGHAHPVKDETCMLCTTPGEIEETGTLQCSVCYENLIEDDDVGCGVCSQGETPVRMHARCRTRWTQYQMCHGISPTCPACRSLVEIIVVCVRTLTGRSIQVGVLGKEGYATVRHLMDATEAQEAIPWQAMRFVFKDRELLPEDKLVDAGIVHGTSVDMVLRVARLEYELLATEFEAVPHPDSPASLRCSLCKAVVTDPVRSASGKLFQRAALMAWMAIRGDLCPVTHSKVLPTVDDPTTRSAAADWLQARQALPELFTAPAAAAEAFDLVARLPLVKKHLITGITGFDTADTVLDRLTLAEESFFSHENCRVFFGYGGACFALEAGIPLWRYGINKTDCQIFCTPRRRQRE